MNSSSGIWKSRIKSTIHTNSRINALLHEPKSFLTAVRQKHVLLSREYRSGQDAQHQLHQQLHRKQSVFHHTIGGEGAIGGGGDDDDEEPRRDELVNGVINVEHIKRMLEHIVEEQMDKETFFRTYNSPISMKFAQILSREILERMKELHLNG